MSRLSVRDMGVIDIEVFFEATDESGTGFEKDTFERDVSASFSLCTFIVSTFMSSFKFSISFSNSFFSFCSCL